MITKKRAPGIRFNPEVATEICGRIARGESIRAICASSGMPSPSTVYEWLDRGAAGDKVYQGFTEQYTRAREAQAEFYADQIVDIADGVLPARGDVDVQRDRLRVESRKWVAAKLLPKKYGDKITQEVTGKDGKPIEFTDPKAALLRGVIPHAPTGGADPQDQ